MMSRGKTHGVLPGGTTVTTAVTDKLQVVGTDATVTQHMADCMALYGGERDFEAYCGGLPWQLHPSALQNMQNRPPATVDNSVDAWHRGGSPDLPDDLTIGQLVAMGEGPGYAKGVERLAELSARIADAVPVPAVLRPRYRWSDEGDDYDILRTYAGQFETAFGGWEPVPYRGPRVVQLNVPLGGNCREDWEAMFWRAACGLAVCDVLQKAGFAVEMYSVNVCAQPEYGSRDSYGVTRVLIKGAGDFENLSSLAYVASLTAWFRTFGFRLNAVTPFAHSAGWGGPRSPASAQAQAALGELGWLDEGRLLSATFDYAATEEESLAAARKVLKTLSDNINIDLGV